VKQVVTNYTFNTSANSVTLTDFNSSYPVDLKRLYLITDVTINAIIYNFADSTVATATISSSNVITLSSLTGAASNSDLLQIVYEVNSNDPIYEMPLLPANAAQETGGNLAAIASAVNSGVMLTAGSLVSSPSVGQAVIASTGTAVQLNGGTSQTLTNGIVVSAANTNVAPISIGNSGVNNTANGSGNGYLLTPGASISFAAANTNELYINGTAGDFVSWAGS
jgi:hypothetical protein